MIEDSLYHSRFPQQKLPLSKKNKKWQEDCVNFIIGEGNIVSGGQTYSAFGELQTYYNLYNSIFDEKDFKKITNPFKVEDGFPATPQDFNIIRPKIDLLIGEETKRPLNFRVVRTSQEATSQLMETQKQMLLQYVQAELLSQLSPEDQANFQEQLANGEIMPPEQIAKYMDKDYKDVVENTAYHTLTYLREKLGLDNEFIKGWKDGLIGGREIYYVGILNSEPYLERVNPMYFSFDKSPDLEFIEDGAWCCRRMRMPIQEVYDRYYDKLTEKDLNKLQEMVNAVPATNLGEHNPVDNFKGIQFHFYDNPLYDEKSNHCVNVWHCCWKSFKKIYYVTTQDDEGQLQVDIVDETYKPVGTEISVEPDWIVEVWEGYRCGNDLFFGIQPIEYQHVSIDNPNSQKLPYCGAVYSATNSKPRSLVSILKPLQYMYIVLWYRLELAIARDKGKVITMDVTQIPKSMGITVDRWMHYLSSVGVNFVNPYECFAPGTRVMMADGSLKNIEDIEIGDQVMGPDGSPRNVTARHTGYDNMYRLKVLTGGDDQIVNSKHLIYYKEKNYFKGQDITKLCNAEDLLAEESTTSYKKNIRYLQRTASIDSDWNKEVLLDPYFMGLWIGDGCMNKTTITNEDPEVINYIVKFGEKLNLHANIKPGNGNALNITLAHEKNNKPNQILEALRYYKICNYKDIPDDYMYTSRENRLQLLAGLLDTDGYYSKRDRYYVFSQSLSHKHIVEKAAFIARSLGFKCTVKQYCGNCNYKKYILGYHCNCEPTVVLTILDGDLEIPCKIRRKQGFVKKTKGSALQSNFKIQYEGVGQYYGITIDGDHLFVLGDYTIVHNCEWNVPGREGGRPAQFNQFTSLDLTMSNVIAEYIQLMDKIEQLAGTITGITEQRQGAISSTELVGNVERSVVQSSHITEPLFWVHNQCKRHALNMLLNTAKGAWQDTGKNKLQYIFDNGERAFLNIPQDFYYQDMDVFVSDTSKDLENINKLQQLIQPAMQNGASLLEAAEILTNDNFNILKQKLKDMQTRQEQVIQQQQQAQQDQAIQIQEMQNQAKQQELALKEAELDLERYKIDQDNATKIAVAEISTYRGTEEKDINQNGIPDPAEMAKDATQQMKIREDAYTKRYESEQKKNIEEQKIALEREKMKHETALQKQKDDAALQREKVKGKFALQNKVTGEK